MWVESSLSVLILKDVDVQKLMRGSPSETLELLQFMHKMLKSALLFEMSRSEGSCGLERQIVSGYDPCERRLRSVKGGTDRIPMPYWMHAHFDIYGRPGTPQSHTFEGKCWCS